MAPPLVLVVRDGASALPALLRDAGACAVDVLADGGPDAFDRVPWTLEQGMPRLEGAASWVRCRPEDLLPGGDHMIAIGRVVHAGASVEPLLYRSRSFGTLASLPAS